MTDNCRWEDILWGPTVLVYEENKYAMESADSFDAHRHAADPSNRNAGLGTSLAYSLLNCLSLRTSLHLTGSQFIS